MGKRNSKSAASDLGISADLFRKYINGKRSPSKLAMCELIRRMELNK